MLLLREFQDNNKGKLIKSQGDIEKVEITVKDFSILLSVTGRIMENHRGYRRLENHRQPN